MTQAGIAVSGAAGVSPDPPEVPVDVAVIGAGPAGALAARQLALAGVSVVLIDKAAFPRDKVCGCCLNAAALATLSSVGLGDLPRNLGAEPITSLELAAPGAHAVLPIRGAALSRAAFDQALVREAIAAGAHHLPRCVASIGTGGELRVRPSAGSEQRKLDARAVLVADGLAGTALSQRPDLAPRVARNERIGLSAIFPSSIPAYPAGAIYMTIGQRGYVGAVRLEDGRLNIAAAVAPEFIRACGGAGPAIGSILDAAGMPGIPGLREAHFHATPALTRRRPRVESGRVLILGDAAGYVEPFTGEGIAWALASAVAIVPAVIARCGQGARESGTWPRVHRRQIAVRQHICRGVAWTLRCPALATAAVRVLGLAPALARPMLGRVARPYIVREALP